MKDSFTYTDKVYSSAATLEYELPAQFNNPQTEGRVPLQIYFFKFWNKI
jgi:hypothetical protein